MFIKNTRQQFWYTLIMNISSSKMSQQHNSDSVQKIGMHCNDHSQVCLFVQPKEPGDLTFDLVLSSYPELKDRTGLCQSDPYDHY